MGDYLMYFITGAALVFAGLVMFISTYPQKKHNKFDGAIRVNTSNPEKDTYTLELDISFGELESRDQVIFEIIHE